MTSFGELVTCIQKLPEDPKEFSSLDRKSLCIAIENFTRDYINETCGTQGPYPQGFKDYKKWFSNEELDSPQSVLLPVLSDYLIPNIPNLHYQAVVALRDKLEILCDYFNRAMVEKIVAENQEDVFKIDSKDEFASQPAETAFSLSIISLYHNFKFYFLQSDAFSICLDHALLRIARDTAAVRGSKYLEDQPKKEVADHLLKKLYCVRNEYVNLPKDKRTNEKQENVKRQMLIIAAEPSVDLGIAFTSLSSAFKFYSLQCCKGQTKKEEADKLLKELYSARNEYVNLTENERTREAQETVKAEMLTIAFNPRVPFAIAATSLSSAFEFYFPQEDGFTIRADRAISSIAEATAAVRQSNHPEDQLKKKYADTLLKELGDAKIEYANLSEGKRTREAQKNTKNKMFDIAFKSKFAFEVAITSLSSVFDFYFPQGDAFSVCVDHAISKITKATAAVRQSNHPEDQLKKEAADKLLRKLYFSRNKYVNLPYNSDARTREAQEAVKIEMHAIAFESGVPFEIAAIPLSNAFEFYFLQGDMFSIQLDCRISIIMKATASVRQSDRPEDQTKKEAANELLGELYRAKNKYIKLSNDLRSCEVQKDIKNEMLGSVAKYGSTLNRYRKLYNSNWHYVRNLIIICINAIMTITIISPYIKYKMTDKEVRRPSSAFFSLATKSQQDADDFCTEVNRITLTRALG